MQTLYSRFSKWFPIPKIMEMYYAGVHISSANIVTYLEMKRVGQDLFPVAYERVAFKRQDDEDISDLVRVLSELHKKYKTCFIKSTIPESKSYLFETEVPKVADRDLKDAISATIEEKAPVALSEVLFGYRLTDTSGADKYVASVGVVPEKVIQNYVDMYGQAGFVPVSIKVEAQAVANAVVCADATCNNIIVSIKDNKTVIAIVQNGGVFLSSTVDFGGKVFDTILAKHFPDLSEKDRHYKKVNENFFNSSTNEQLQMEFIEQAALLKNYLNKYYIYWLTHKATVGGNTEQKLDSFIIVGDEVCMPGLVDYLKSQLKARIEVGNVWRNCFDLSNHIPEIPYENSFDYAETVGLLIGKD